MKGEEGFADGLAHAPADFGFAVKLHLAFGGVDVDIHGRRIQFEKKAAHGIAALHEGGVVTLHEGVVQPAVFHGPAVHKEVLALARGTRNAGGPDEPPYAEGGGRRRGFRQRGRRAGGQGGFKNVRFGGRGGFVEGGQEVDGQEFFHAQEGAEAFAQGLQTAGNGGAGFLGGKLPDQAAVFLKREGHFGIRERREGEIMLHLRGLGLLGAQEFAAGGQVEKQLAHLDTSARRTAGRLDFGDATAGDDHLGALGGIARALAGGQGKTADAGDAGEGLAAKTHGGDGGQILGQLDFAGGMAFEA